MLSGGERVRCALARVMQQNSYVLLFDVPTDYLDLPTLEALTKVLVEYSGTVIFVSHDRRFMEETAKRLLIIEENQLQVFGLVFSLPFYLAPANRCLH